MKSLFKAIIFLFNYLMNFRTIYRFKKINKKLGQKLQDREVERIILKGRIVKMVKHYIQLNTSSKFIPPWFKSNAEIKQEILIKYGNDMEKLGIKLYNNLKLSA